MALHAWWSGFGSEVSDIGELTPVLARELASLAAANAFTGVTLIGLRQAADMGYAGVALDLEVERPQDLAHPIKAVEPIAVLFRFGDGPPTVLSLRDEFPDTLHQNWSPPGGPAALCIDDRPWQEARLSATANDIVRRIQLWLAKAARGELHDPAQPPDPLFYTTLLGIVLPTEVLGDGKKPIELAGFVRQDNQNLIIAMPADSANQPAPFFTVLTFRAQPQAMAPLRRAPDTLAALAAELDKRGIHLVDEIKTRLRASSADMRRLSLRFVIVIEFPVAESAGRSVNDFRAFLTVDTAGEIGVALGVLLANDNQVGDKRAYVPAIFERPLADKELRIDLAQVHFAFDRNVAAKVAGHGMPDLRRAVLIGAGSLGSQLSLDLAREGAFAWTVVDDDYLLPHNFARHALFAEEIGAPKAGALAHKLQGLLGEPVEAIQGNVLTPGDKAAPRLAAAFAQADVIIDTSASVAVSRHLADLPNVQARRICAFFNPSGTAVVVLAEDAGRTLTLRDLEAQYHRLVLTEARLAGHLATSGPGVRYTGSCRALTNRISASNAAILSALAAHGILAALAGDQPTISVWTMNPDGEVQFVRRAGATVTRAQLGAWAIAYDADLLNSLIAMRKGKLPNETGGVLLGVADMTRKSVHIAHALPQPADSQASQTEFERGVTELTSQVGAAVDATLHQLRYVGEWHSHPDRASAMPSAIDLSQLLWLGEELQNEGLPGLIAIAAEDGRLTIALGQVSEPDGRGA
jgi:proteasome lid subunit RPN8/RPN11